MDLNLLLILVAAAFVLAVAYAAVNYLLVRRLKEGSRRMQEIAAALARLDEAGKLVHGAGLFAFAHFSLHL